MQRADELSQRHKHLVAGGFGRQRLPWDVSGDVGQDFAALFVDTKRNGCSREPGLVQVRKVSLDRGGERPDRPPYGVADSHYAGRDTIPGERFPAALIVGQRQRPSLVGPCASEIRQLPFCLLQALHGDCTAGRPGTPPPGDAA